MPVRDAGSTPAASTTFYWTNVGLSEVIEFYLKRHPIGLPSKTIREVVDELIASKASSGKSAVYIKDLNSRLGAFANNFNVRISNVTGKQIEEYIRGLKTLGSDESQRRSLAGRTQNNIRRLVSTLFKFAIKRGYLPKDHDEISAVERATVDSSDIEVFSPAELQKLFAACLMPVKERGKWRTREEMIPYLAVAAFCGLRAAEIQRLDWSQIHLVGPEKFVEVTAGNAKTASRRTVPINDNCAAGSNATPKLPARSSVFPAPTSSFSSIWRKNPVCRGSTTDCVTLLSATGWPW